MLDYCKMKTTVMIAFISKMVCAGPALAVTQLLAVTGMRNSFH